MDGRLVELCFEPQAATAQERTHLAACAHCRVELERLQATLGLLDSWEAPAPSPYFMARLNARMREERQSEPVTWWTRWMERQRDRWAYGAAAPVRPVAAMALTVVLLVGGGTYLGTSNWDAAPTPGGQASVVHELQTMDNNAQLLDSLEALSNANDNGSN